MKKTHFFLLFSLLFWSCTNEVIEGDFLIPTTNSVDINHNVSIEKALSELNIVMKGINDFSSTRNINQRQVSTISTIKISDVGNITRSSKAINTDKLMYIANFENEAGYAILGADDRLASIIAIIDQGNLKKEQLINSVKELDYISQQPLILSNVINYALQNVVGNQIVPLDSLMKTYYGEWQTLIKVGPLVKTKWSQDYPYNYYKTDSPAGCVAVALGQLITAEFYKWRSNSDVSFGKIDGAEIDWRNIFSLIADGQYWLPNVSDKGKAVAWLLRKCGTAVNTFYAPDGSSAYSKDIVPVLNQLGFKGVCMADYNQDIIMSRIALYDNSIYISATDIISGVGHAWLIDGVYKQNREVVKKLSNAVVDRWTETRILLHINLGWEGYCDGYYYPGIFDLSKGPEFRDEGDNGYYCPNINYSKIKQMYYYDSYN